MDPGPSKPNSRPTVHRPATETKPTVHTIAEPLGGPAEPFLSPPQLSGELGRLGSYRVLAELGRGGMGIVYRAEETDLKREVALKVMLPEVANDARARARFIREAQAQAKVNDDHVVAIHRVGEENGVPFIAMPLLKGQTLADALRKNPRPPLSEVVRIGREMALGLAAAHACGLIHRDIKPGNVWLEGPRRRVKILDFGLARQQADSASSKDDITSTGAILGTPAFMAPEQARSQPIDHRTDLFSVGVILYLMATGQRPFSGESAFDVMAAVVSHNPPLAQAVIPELPEALSDLIGRLMAKNPAGRPASAESVVEELEAIERELISLPTQAIVLPAVVGEPNPWANIDGTNSEGNTESEGQRLLDSQSDAKTYDSRRDESRVDESRRGDSEPGGREPRAARKPRNPQQARLVWWLTAGACLLALVASAVAVVKLALPRGESIVEKEKQNPPVTPITPQEKLSAKQPPFTPNAEYKAAGKLIPYAALKAKSASGQEMVLEKGKPLPQEEFNVTEIEFLVAFPQADADRDFLPAILEMKSLVSIRADVWMFQVYDAQLLTLAESPLARTLEQLELGFELNSKTFEALKKFPKLSTLACNASRVNDKLLGDLAQLTPTLKVISLEYLGTSAKVTDTGLTALAKLPLTHVGLAGSNVASDFIRLIRANSKATEFNFWGSTITNDDLKILAECSHIQHLLLGGTEITDAGLKHLEGMKQLTDLGIRNTKINEAAAKELAKKLPRCRIDGPVTTIQPTEDP